MKDLAMRNKQNFNEKRSLSRRRVYMTKGRVRSEELARKSKMYIVLSCTMYQLPWSLSR